MGSNAAVSEDVHGPGQPANQSVHRRVWLARGVVDGFKGELVAGCVFCGLTDVIFASAVLSVGRCESVWFLGGGGPCRRICKRRRIEGYEMVFLMWEEDRAAKRKKGMGFALLCFALMVLGFFFLVFRPWQPHPSSSSTTANVTLNQRLQP